MGEHSLLVDDSYWTHQRLRHNRAATTDPTVDDDATIGASGGYGVGSLWINTSTGAAFVCVDATIGAAVWKDWQTYLLESDLWEWWNNITMAGRLYGGAITDNGDGTVAVAAGGGIIKADEAGPEDGPASVNAGQASVLSNVTWGAVASLALTDDAYNYIYYDGSAGVIAATTNFYAISFTRDFTLGRVYRDGTTVTIRLCGTNTWNFNRRVQLFGEEVFPVVKATGLIPSESGTRGIAVTAGVLWAELVNRFSIDAIDTAGSDSFTAWYRDGGTGWTTIATQTQVNNTQYDDGDGTLGTLTANRYGVHWIYVVHDNSLHVVFGQGDYLLAQAGEAAPPATLPGLLAAYATLIGKIIVQKSATNFTSIEAPSEISFTPTSVTDHGGLAGLTDDDHPHYLLDKLSGGAASEVPEHTHADAANAGTVAHSTLTGIGSSDHHTRYADSEAVSAMGAKDASNPLNHDRYTDSESVSAMGVKGNANPLNHDRYADSEAVSAMGVKGNANPLNHDRYTDSEAVTAAKTVKLDDFASPDDNTDLNASTGAHGLLPKLGGGTDDYLRADGTWATPPGTGGGGAPTTADYLVGTAQAGLSAEIVVGTTPGGELGGTWASPTVDATHSGSTHAATQAAAEATAAGALSSHVSDGDPHTGYRLESADHNHQSTGAQAGQLDHGAALTGLTDDDHTQYLLASGARDVAGDLVPDADSTRDLGTSTDRWAELHVDDILGTTKPIVRSYTDTAGDSWTVPTAPPTLAYIIVEVVGGGGGSGGIDATGSNEASASGGGGGGGYSRKLIPASTLSGNTYAITVGVGGDAGTSGGGNGGDGGDSSFAGTGVNVLGEGGTGGVGDAAASTGVTEQAGGAGGAASGGDVNIAGSAGINGITAPVGTTGRSLWTNVAGGASHWAGSVPATSFDVAGVAGNVYGGGAAGARNNAASSSNRAGAAGGQGRVIVTEYYV